jgi:hypothetical protein
MIVRSIAACVFLVAIVPVVAHSDTIGLYDYFGGWSCNITDGFAYKTVYVVHWTSGNVTASAFSAPKPACWTNATWVSDTDPWGWPGSSQTGKWYSYGMCITEPRVLYLMTINYVVQGSSPPCCLYPLLPNPYEDPEHPIVVDCANNNRPVAGLVATINGNATCPCGNPVPVEETTWGRVKALYAE